MILEEFGRCLIQVIQSANKTKGTGLILLTKYCIFYVSNHRKLQSCYFTVKLVPISVIDDTNNACV